MHGGVKMESTVTIRGQTAIPVEIRKRYNIHPQTKLEWIDDGHTITVLPIPPDSIIAATAIEKEAVLVHKDPELKAISNYVKTLELPFKEKTFPSSLPGRRKK